MKAPHNFSIIPMLKAFFCFNFVFFLSCTHLKHIEFMMILFGEITFPHNLEIVNIDLKDIHMRL